MSRPTATDARTEAVLALDALAPDVRVALAELIRAQRPQPVDADGAARLVGFGVEWVRAHWRELGGWKSGNGPKARIRFDAEELVERARTIADDGSSASAPDRGDQTRPAIAPRGVREPASTASGAPLLRVGPKRTNGER